MSTRYERRNLIFIGPHLYGTHTVTKLLHFQIIYWTCAFLILFVSGLPHLSPMTSLVRNLTFGFAGFAFTQCFLPLSVASLSYQPKQRLTVWIGAVVILTLLMTAIGNIATFWYSGTPPNNMTLADWTAGGLHLVWVLISWALALEFFVSRQDVVVEAEITRSEPPSTPSPTSIRAAKGDGSATNINITEVIRIIAAGDYAEVHLEGRSYLTKGPLKSLAERLKPAGFIQIGRSAIVNCAHVEEVQAIGRGRFDLKLRDGSTISTSRRSAETIRQSLLTK